MVSAKRSPLERKFELRLVHGGAPLQTALSRLVAKLQQRSAAQPLVRAQEANAFGDAGYRGVHKREEAQVPQWHIAMQPGKGKQLSDSPLGQMLEKVEKIKASIRAKVEHPFHVIKDLFRHRKTRYRGLAKNHAQLFSLFGLANLVIAKKRLLAIHGGGAS